MQHKMLLKNYPFCRFSYLASFWNSLEDHSYVWKGHKIFYYYLLHRFPLFRILIIWWEYLYLNLLHSGCILSLIKETIRTRDANANVYGNRPNLPALIAFFCPFLPNFPPYIDCFNSKLTVKWVFYDHFLPLFCQLY